jgi:hypothetical protein
MSCRMSIPLTCASWFAAGCMTSEPSPHPDVDAYSSPSAIETAGGARIALQQHEDWNDGPIVIASFDFASNTVGSLAAVSGARGTPSLAGNDARAYLTWSNRAGSSGGLLSSDLTVSAPFEFCNDCTTRSFAVGERFLVVERRVNRQDARWIESNGTVGAAFPFPGELEKTIDTSTGTEQGATLVQRHNLPDALVRTDGLEIDLQDAETMWTVGVLPDGALLATYNTVTEGRIVRVEPDGTVTTRKSEEPCMPQIVVAADRIFGLCGRYDDHALDVTAYELDDHGAFLDGGALLVDDAPPGSMLERLSIFAIGRDLVVVDSGAWPTATHFDGELAAPVRIAGGYAGEP